MEHLPREQRLAPRGVLGGAGVDAPGRFLADRSSIRRAHRRERLLALLPPGSRRPLDNFALPYPVSSYYRERAVARPLDVAALLAPAGSCCRCGVDGAVYDNNILL